MQIQHDIHEELRRQREANQEVLIAMQTLQSLMNRTVALVGCVTLVDATGHDHAIPVNFCTSFQVCSPASKFVLWTLTDQILCSNSIRCSKFCLNVTPSKHAFRNDM